MIAGFDAGSGRYAVDLGGGTRLKVKPANLLQRLRVRLCGLEGDRLVHNGEAGTLVGWHASVVH